MCPVYGCVELHLAKQGRAQKGRISPDHGLESSTNVCMVCALKKVVATSGCALGMLNLHHTLIALQRASPAKKQSFAYT